MVEDGRRVFIELSAVDERYVLCGGLKTVTMTIRVYKPWKARLMMIPIDDRARSVKVMQKRRSSDKA